MNPIEQARLNSLYAAMLCALQLQSKAEKTVEAYARAIRHYVSNAHGYLFKDLGAFFRLETAPAAGFLLDIWLIPAATQPASR